jgi:hypothetical protein
VSEKQTNKVAAHISNRHKLVWADGGIRFPVAAVFCLFVFMSPDSSKTPSVCFFPNKNLALLLETELPKSGADNSSASTAEIKIVMSATFTHPSTKS